MGEGFPIVEGIPVRAPDYVLRREDGTHVLRSELRTGSAVQVYRPGDELPESVAAELAPAAAVEPAKKPVRKTTKPRRATTKEG